MAGTRKTKQNVPLIVEEHPEGYSGYPFITLIQYNQNHFLTIVDNADEKSIKAFVLDLCSPENVNEENIVNVTTNWYVNFREKYPLSIEFSKLGMTNETSKILRTFQTEFVSRVIGPLPTFSMKNNTQIRRRKRKPLPSNISIIRKPIVT